MAISGVRDPFAALAAQDDEFPTSVANHARVKQSRSSERVIPSARNSNLI